MTAPVEPPPDCGTPGTPPCPPPDLFFETRALVIDRLAGAHATRERRRSITAQVDTYLQAALRNAFVLMRGAQVPAAERTLERDGERTLPDSPIGVRRRHRPAHVAVAAARDRGVLASGQPDAMTAAHDDHR